MIHTDLAEISRVVSGKLIGESRAIVGAEFDSRRVKPGHLFCALPGAATHGHAFVDSIAKVGAGGALVEDAEVLAASKLPGVVVKDSLAAMQRLAAWWRTKVGVPVLAITGSVGKTTTKEIAAAILGTGGKGTFPRGSFNNHVGVPYTLLQIAPDDLWAIIEIGMNHRGEIAPLSRMTAPDVALVTAIAPAHIGNLGSLRAIAQEKLDIAAGLKPGGILILNGDSELLRDPKLLTDLQPGFSKPVYFSPTADIGRGPSALNVRSIARTDTGLKLSLSLDGIASIGEDWREVLCDVPLFGTHHATNVAAALLGTLSLGVTLQKSRVVTALRDFDVPEQRCVRRPAKDGGGQIFDDSYNANPASMRAFFAATQPFCANKSSWGVVLGEMRELDDFSVPYHREIAEFVAALKPTFVIAVGVDGARIYEEVFHAMGHPGFLRVDDATGVVAALGTRTYDVLLVKGARGLKLERFVNLIAA